jgi:hypothetical protein
MSTALRRPPDPRNDDARGQPGARRESRLQASADRNTYRVVATKANGRSAIVLSNVSRATAERWAALHRRFANAAGGDVRVEHDAP